MKEKDSKLMEIKHIETSNYIITIHIYEDGTAKIKRASASFEGTEELLQALIALLNSDIENDYYSAVIE